MPCNIVQDTKVFPKIILSNYYIITLASGDSLNTRNIASSAATVFPDPVGAPNKTFTSE